jgi:hypothetical protein
VACFANVRTVEAQSLEARATEEGVFIARCYVTHATGERVSTPRPPRSLLRNTEVTAVGRHATIAAVCRFLCGQP